MNIYAYTRMRHKVKDSPCRVVVRDHATDIVLADIQRNFDEALAPFSEREIVATRWLDENKDAIVLLVD